MGYIMAESLFLKNNKENMHDFVPISLSDYKGQSELKKRLALYIQAAHVRSEPLDHILLFGPPGLGKTTLASIIAYEMKVSLKTVHGPSLQRTGDLVAVLSSLKSGAILFIDEVHRISMPVEETLYTAMEQYHIDIIIGQGNNVKTVRMPLQPFTLIGATTRAGLLSEPFQTRFGLIEKFDLYHKIDLTDIVLQAAVFLCINFEKDAAELVADRSRGTPRIAKKLTRKVRDFVQVHKKDLVTVNIAREALDFFGIKEHGLTDVDRSILDILSRSNKPLSLATLAALLGEEAETVELVYEPYLIHKGFIDRTVRGRVLGSAYTQLSIHSL